MISKFHCFQFSVFSFTGFHMDFHKLRFHIWVPWVTPLPVYSFQPSSVRFHISVRFHFSVRPVFSFHCFSAPSSFQFSVCQFSLYFRPRVFSFSSLSFVVLVIHIRSQDFVLLFPDRAPPATETSSTYGFPHGFYNGFQFAVRTQWISSFQFPVRISVFRAPGN